MKIIRLVITLLTVFPSAQAHCQDIVSIYFEFGIDKIHFDQLRVLNALQTQYDLSVLDSVHFVGRADSVGDLKSNMKLSYRRAKNVAKQCERLLPENTPIKIFAKGEDYHIDRPTNRRVDIILFFKSIEIEEKVESKGYLGDSNDCYIVDYSLLNQSFIEAVTIKNKEFIVVTTEVLPGRQIKHFSGTISNGDFMVKKLKWKHRETGKLWWLKNRYVATIPKADFDSFRIFLAYPKPCTYCREDFRLQQGFLSKDSCLWVDRFLMNNLQYKTIIFNRHEVKIRAPKEYVLADRKYFVEYDEQDEIKWQPKKGRKKQDYLYTTLPRDRTEIANITRRMGCCRTGGGNGARGADDNFHCGYSSSSRSKYLMFLVELGVYHRLSEYTPYAGLLLEREVDKSQIGILTGTDSDLSFYGALRYKYHYFSFPYSLINPFPRWRRGKFNPDLIYARLYVGTEFNTKLNNADLNHFEKNIHAGFATTAGFPDAFFLRAFIQYGLAFGYRGGTSEGLYPIFQFGIVLKIREFDIQ